MISGYYGLGNFGDELILFSMLSSLRKLDNSLAITVLSADPEFTGNTYEVQAIKRTNIFTFWKELKKTDLFISGGGGLLQDISSFRSSFYYLGLIFLAQIFGKKTFFYAQGIGRLRNWLLRFFTFFVVNRMDGVTLRDENSKMFLQSLGVSRPKIEVTADPVFALDIPSRLISEKKELKRIGFILRKTGTKEKKQLLAVIDLIQEKLNSEIFLLSFQEREDLFVAEEIKKLRENRIELFRWQNFTQLFNFFSKIDLVVSMRLHGLILGILQNRVVIGLSADPKIKILGETFSFPVISLDDLKNENLYNLILETWRKREKYYKIVQEKIPESKRKAERTAELVLTVLRN